MNYEKLNLNWNADPNAPEPIVEVQGVNVRIEFFLNHFLYDQFNEGDKGELIFFNCYKFSFNSWNDEGYYRGQHRYNIEVLPWGEFYELDTNWEIDFPEDAIVINSGFRNNKLKHFIFFFRDDTFECIAENYEFKYLNE